MEGLTIAIIVYQERMGAEPAPRSAPPPTPTRFLRVLFNRLGKPYVASSKAFSFNVLSVRGGGQISIEKGAGKTEKRVSGGACHSSAGPALELRRGFQLKSL